MSIAFGQLTSRNVRSFFFKVKLPEPHNDVVESPAVSRKVKTTLFKPVYPQQKTKVFLIIKVQFIFNFETYVSVDETLLGLKSLQLTLIYHY